MINWALLLILTITTTAQSAYVLDAAWPSQPLPANTSRFTAVAVVLDTVYVVQRDANYSQPLLLLNRTDGNLISTEGKSFITNGGANGYGVHGMNSALLSTRATLWITDVFNYTVSVVSVGSGGTLISRIGTPGKAGTGVRPILQFGNVADVDFDVESAVAYISDGDGGVNSRVVAVNMTTMMPIWVVGTNGSAVGEFSSPHTLTFHPPSGTVLVGDRGNSRIVQLSATNGNVLDVMDVKPLAPWGLRYEMGRDVVIMADGADQSLLILDAKRINGSGLGPKSIMQTIAVDKAKCNAPHELAVDHELGDFYLACVTAPSSNIQRYLWSV